MNIGGDPDRDDYGLPRVDVEIPDDARELDRDVLAYHRELRARRRKLLARRVRGPLGHDGMVLPLLASCLALTLLAGTLLTMFAAGRAAPLHGPATSTLRSPTPQAGRPNGPLPDVIDQVGGTLVHLRNLPPAVLVLVPPACRCGVALQRLSGQAFAANVSIYYVAGHGGMPQARTLATQAGRSSAEIISDPSDTLATTYHRSGLTAILVNAGGLVHVTQRNLGPRVQLADRLKTLVYTFH